MYFIKVFKIYINNIISLYILDKGFQVLRYQRYFIMAFDNEAIIFLLLPMFFNI